MSDLRAPFPYFGGKSKLAAEVWRRFGPDVRNYVEPFAGSAAMLLARPQPFDGVETINDADGMVANFWRALQHDPEQTAHWLDWPVNENDLTARHIWLVNRKESLQVKLEGDPDYYDAKIAGWWCWGMCCWIGSGWCSGVGPWQSVDGELANVKEGGVWKQRVHLSNAGRGVNRQLVHLGDAGMGVHRKREGNTCAERTAYLVGYMQGLADRLRHVRVCCGDWQRVIGSETTLKTFSPTAVFLDPPYAHSERDAGLYAVEMVVATEVREWALAHGNDPAVRIALCGYDSEHAMPGWTEYAWKAAGGYGGQNKAEQAGRGEVNRHRERVWFSPHCSTPMMAFRAPSPLFEMALAAE